MRAVALEYLDMLLVRKVGERWVAPDPSRSELEP